MSCQQSSGGDADDAEEPASDSDSSEVRRVCGGGCTHVSRNYVLELKIGGLVVHRKMSGVEINAEYG